MTRPLCLRTSNSSNNLPEYPDSCTSAQTPQISYIVWLQNCHKRSQSTQNGKALHLNENLCDPTIIHDWGKGPDPSQPLDNDQCPRWEGVEVNELHPRLYIPILEQWVLLCVSPPVPIQPTTPLPHPFWHGTLLLSPPPMIIAHGGLPTSAVPSTSPPLLLLICTPVRARMRVKLPAVCVHLSEWRWAHTPSQTPVYSELTQSVGDRPPCGADVRSLGVLTSSDRLISKEEFRLLCLTRQFKHG